MGKLIKFFLIAVAALGVIGLALVYLVPMDVYRDQIEQAAERATGRDLKINGGLSLSLYPTIGIKAESVTFANAQGGKGEFMATMDSLVVGLELFPLISGDLRVRELVLTKPVIHLEVDKSGKPNWDFGGASSAPAPEQAGGGTSLGNLSFGDVRISGGSLTYDNYKTGTHETIGGIDVDVELADLDSPLSLDGALDYKGERVNIDLKAEKPRAFMDGGSTPLSLALDADALDASVNGNFDMGSGAISGALDMRTSSVRRLMGWLGSPMGGNSGFGAMSLKGALAASGSAISIKNAQLTFDGMNGTGALSLDTGGSVPSVKGSLALDRLDANQYLGGGGGGHAASGRAPSGWSDDPISLSGLRAINADLAFTAGEVAFQNIKTGKAALQLTIKGGVLTANMSELALYEGSGKAQLTADGSKATPAVKVSFGLSGIKALPFLTDAMDMKFLDGTGAFNLNVTGAGKSERAIMSSLAGSGSMNFTNGAIKGIDLGQIASTIASALSGSAVGGNAETEFTKLAATFTIKNGVLSNDDLNLTGPHISMTGKGVIDLGRQTMKYRVEPKAFGNAPAQGQAASLGIPFVIQGPWSKLSYLPDLENVIGGSINSLLSGKGIQNGIPGLDQIIPGLGGLDGQGAPSIPGLPAIPGVTPQSSQPTPQAVQPAPEPQTQESQTPAPANEANQPPPPANDSDQAPASDVQQAPAAETPPASGDQSAPAAASEGDNAAPVPTPQEDQQTPEQPGDTPASGSESDGAPPPSGN